MKREGSGPGMPDPRPNLATARSPTRGRASAPWPFMCRPCALTPRIRTVRDGIGRCAERELNVEDFQGKWAKVTSRTGIPGRPRYGFDSLLRHSTTCGCLAPEVGSRRSGSPLGGRAQRARFPSRGGRAGGLGERGRGAWVGRSISGASDVETTRRFRQGVEAGRFRRRRRAPRDPGGKRGRAVRRAAGVCA
jgi:hypothetical protein